MARSISGSLPWQASSAAPPEVVTQGALRFFTDAEADLFSAIADRLIPADDLSVSGSEAGCVIYIDAQLAGSYGQASRLYMQGPFQAGLPTQGYQHDMTPAQRYRAGLAAIASEVESRTPGQMFADWRPADQDAFLTDLEGGKVALSGDIEAASLFSLVLEGVMEGFFADPVYGGNKDMASWKMIGFPGARYDYRPFVGQHNQPYPYGPMSIMGNPDWVRKEG